MKSRILRDILFVALFSVVAVSSVFAQAKRPELMVIPSREWCNSNGFMTTVENQGVSQSFPNYRKALDSSAQLGAVIAKISELMNEREFPLVDLGATLSAIEQSEVDMSVLQSSQGSSIVETPMDRILSGLKSDIKLEVSWSVNKIGPQNSITYTLRGIDAYSNKAIASITGTGAKSFSAEIPVLLEEAVIANMDSFTEQLQTYFNDILENGREVVIDVRVFDTGTGINLESEFKGGEELLQIIEDWFYDNTVQHRYYLGASSENMATFRQIRIPLYDERGRAIDTRRYANELRKYMQKEPFNLPVKLINKGLGYVILVIGEK